MNYPVNESGAIDWDRVKHSWHRLADPESTLEAHECDVSQCLFCVHLHGHLADERADGHLREGKPSCAAYPCGIPMAIWYNKHNHRKSYEGDKGVVFQADLHRK